MNTKHTDKFTNVPNPHWDKMREPAVITEEHSARIIEAMRPQHKDSFDESYHYWRECHKCGHAGNHYLHCLHDKIQSDCIKCGDKLPSIPQDCDCEFATTETELDMNTKHTDTCKCVPFNKDILDTSECKLHHVSTQHTDSVEAITQEAVFIHQAFQRAKPHDYHKPFEELDQECQRVMRSIASELIARNQQKVEEAVRKERERIIKLLDWRNRKDSTQFYDGSDIVDWYDKKIEALTTNHQD